MENNNISDENDVLKKALDLFADLDQEARARIIRTLTTYFLDTQLPIASKHTIPYEHLQRKETPSHERVFSGHRELSPKEFMQEKAPKTDVERVVCLAYYLSHYLNTPHFKTAEISKLNTEAAQRKLANAAYAVNNATQGGYFVDAPGGDKQLSVMGEHYVEALPEREALREIKERFQHRQKRYKKKTKKNGTATKGQS